MSIKIHEVKAANITHSIHVGYGGNEIAVIDVDEKNRTIKLHSVYTISGLFAVNELMSALNIAKHKIGDEV